MKAGILASLLGLSAACGGFEGKPTEAVQQQQRAPRFGRTDANVEPDPGFVGVVLPAASVDVAPGFEGKIDTVGVVVGQQVALGESLATLDTAAAREDLRMAQAELKMAKGVASEAAASVRQADDELKTNRTLFDQGIIAARDVSDAVAERARAAASTTSAAGRIAAAKARIDQFERQLAETSLLAPFAGTVAVVYLESGELAGDRKPVLRLIRNEGTFVRFAVPPARVDDIVQGTRVEVILEDEVLEVSATVREIAPEVDAPTGLVFVEATLAPLDADRVRPNSKAWVRTRR